MREPSPASCACTASPRTRASSAKSSPRSARRKSTTSAHHPKFNGAANPFQQHVAAVVAPLLHGTRSLGVLAAASPDAPPFSQHALEMFASLAEQIGFALGNAQAHHEAGAKRSLEAELRNASEIQRILLPEKAPDTPGLEIVGRNIPARLVCGDYYDFFPDRNRACRASSSPTSPARASPPR